MLRTNRAGAQSLGQFEEIGDLHGCEFLVAGHAGCGSDALGAPAGEQHNAFRIPEVGGGLDEAGENLWITAVHPEAGRPLGNFLRVRFERLLKSGKHDIECAKGDALRASRFDRGDVATPWTVLELKPA